MRGGLGAAGIVAVAAVFFAPELVGGRLAVTGNIARWRPWAEAASLEARQSPSVSLDCNLSYWPRRVVMHRSWREGILPFWNPYSFCGTPFLADVQTGVLYPPNWLLLPLEPARQLGWFLFLHAAWAGLGVFVLARGFGVPAAIAFLCGVAWSMNGYFAKHYGQPTFLATAAWMPWVVHLALQVSRRLGPARSAKLALAGAMTFLAGQPQLALYAAYAAALVVAVERAVARNAERRPPLPRVALALGGAGALAVILVAAQLLPTRALAELSARADLAYASVISGAFHPVELLRLAVPDFFGSPLTEDEWSILFPLGDGFYIRNQMNSLFAGTPVFLLALWGMTARATRRASLPFTVLFVVSVLLAFASPLARAAYEALPGFRFARIDRVGSVAILAQIVPAALAAAELAKPGGRARRVFGGAVVVLAVAGAAFVARSAADLPALLGADLSQLPGGVLDAETASRVVQRTALAALFAAATGVVYRLRPSPVTARLPLLLAAAQLFLFASPYRLDRRPDDAFPRAPGVDGLRALLDADAAGGGGRFVRFGRDMPIRPYPLSSVLPPSTNVPYALRDLQGYNALADRKLGEALETAWGEDVFSHGIWTGRRIVAPERTESLEHPLLDALAVCAAVSGGTLRAEGWVAEPSTGFRVWRNTEALPRVRLVPAGRGVSAGEMTALLRDGRLDPRSEVLWVGSGTAGGAAPAESGSARVHTDSWNELEVRVRTEEEAVLVVADSFDEGWEATLNSRRVEILPVYGVVRGVVVPRGDHVVRMRYVPPGFEWGVALSCLGLALAGTALAVARED